jgi:hypothetical protein
MPLRSTTSNIYTVSKLHVALEYYFNLSNKVLCWTVFNIFFLDLVYAQRDGTNQSKLHKFTTLFAVVELYT